MADWFVTVEAVEPAEAPPAVVYECIAYREALALAHQLAERDPEASVEVVDFSGRVVMSLGWDQREAVEVFTSIPLRAGVYAWQESSETYRLVRC